MRILMVEDEKYMVEAITHILKKNNYTVDVALDGLTGLDNALSDIYDAIILDIMLPNLDGITLLKNLRNEDIKTPVIMLSAKGELSDKIIGLDSGADDYLPKPFQSEELLARLRAITRRNKDSFNNDVLLYGNIELDSHTLILKCLDNSFKLTLKEAQTLEILMNNKEHIVHKENIIEKLWGFDEEANDNTVEVYISFLRKKLNNLKANVCIETVRNAGYRVIVKRND